jgi:hypothetical protein
MEEHSRHDVGRHFDEVKRRAGGFVEGASTALATKDSIAEVGGPRQLGGLGRMAVGAVHGTRAGNFV